MNQLFKFKFKLFSIPLPLFPNLIVSLPFKFKLKVFSSLHLYILVFLCDLPPKLGHFNH